MTSFHQAASWSWSPNLAASLNARGPETGAPEMEETARREMMTATPPKRESFVSFCFCSEKFNERVVSSVSGSQKEESCEPSYMPKVPTTPFRDQEVNLQALPLEEVDPALALLCPVRALRQYVDRIQNFRTSEQLFLFWRTADGEGCLQTEDGPLDSGCHHHGLWSTRCALPAGASLADICRPAGWVTPNTFARFYSLRVKPVSSCALTSNG